MRLIVHISIIVILVYCIAAQDINLPSLSDEEYEDEEEFQKEILVIPNRFPNDLNFFCEPKTDLMRDRLCFGQLDAFALACSEDTPPLQLVPFCLAFKDKCTKITYPSDEMCSIEKRKFKEFCTRTRRNSCKSCKYGYDVSCTCEPYECIWRRYGFETARWCQQYELFCNKKKRREKGNELVALMKDAVKVHYKCMHMFNLPRVICHPFRRQFDWHRCMKFLFDCELISDFSDEVKVVPEVEKEKKIEEKIEIKEKDGEKKITITEKEMIKEVVKQGDSEKEKVKTKEEVEIKKVTEDEKLFEKLIKESEKEEKLKTSSANATETAPPHPFASVKLPGAANVTEADAKVLVVEQGREPVTNLQLPKEEEAKKIAEDEKLLEKLIQEDEKQSMGKSATTSFPTLVPSNIPTATSEHPFARVTLKPNMRRN